MLLSVIALVVLGFLAVELHYWLERRRALPLSERKTLKDVVIALKNVGEKAEFLPPMDEAEYDAYMEEQSPKGSLLKKIADTWNSKPPTSPSSGS